MLDADKRDKLAKVLGMLGSQDAGERAAAAAASDKFLKKLGLNWSDVAGAIGQLAPSPATAPAPSSAPNNGEAPVSSSYDTPWQAASPKDGRPGSWRRCRASILVVRQCRAHPGRPPAWFAMVDGSIIYGAGGRQFFVSEEEAQAAADAYFGE